MAAKDPRNVVMACENFASMQVQRCGRVSSPHLGLRSKTYVIGVLSVPPVELLSRLNEVLRPVIPFLVWDKLAVHA